jgi:two-component system phosphate regulon sensor histidine kinase PhoR
MRSDFSSDVDKLKKYAEIIYKENKRLEQQVERVLNVAKLDKEKLVLKKDWESIHTLLAAAKESFEINQTDSGATISLQCEASIDRLYIDEVHITNVIYNLLDNAVKYCNETPHITITTHSNQSYFILSVADNGIGIQKEDVKLIFDKFYRVPTGNLHNVKGFGLGLYYVKLITEAHEGYIKVKSNLGSGTNFELYLPLTKIDQ